MKLETPKRETLDVESKTTDVESKTPDVINDIIKIKLYYIFRELYIHDIELQSIKKESG